MISALEGTGSGRPLGSAASSFACRHGAGARTPRQRTLLDDLALRHDADPVGDLADDAEVVGDEQHRHAEERAFISARSFRICAWTVTSSAVVGSSAMNRSGSFASAIAIMTRWRCRPRAGADRRRGGALRRAGRQGRASRACARAAPAPTACGAASRSRRPAARSCAAG